MPIVDLIKETCEDLIHLHQKNPTHTKLLFPRYRKGEARISEQEARFCFAAVAERGTEYRYSVETPTLETYSFTDGGGRISAQTDLTLWDLDGKNKEFNIEFKAKNPGDKSIDKDIEKLLKEKIDGVWFHLFENADSGTFPRLGEKFESAVTKHYNALLVKHPGLKKEILFAVCSLGNGVGIVGKLSLPTDINAFFRDGAALLQDPQKGQEGDWKTVVFMP